jgi:UDP-N-acetylglucosamine--dolichyl-phosphate N-acetylglucosaminephosphotransferase
MSLFPFVSAFILTFVATPYFAKYLKRKGIVGIDLHKEGNLKIPEMGGVAIFFSTIVVLSYNYMVGFDELLAPLFALYIIGTLGIIDGFLRLSAVQKISSFFVIGIFLTWGLGFRGLALYLLLGFLFMATVNFTNMLAGFNGLEIGTGAIAAIGLTIVSFLAGKMPSFIISSTLAGALLAFLFYNWFPAKVFPGDVGTLIIGSALFSSAILGGLYIPAIVIFTPYIIDASLKFISAGVMTRESQKPTIVKNGKLYVPKDTNLSLARVFLRRRALTEKEVVKKVWIAEAIFVSIAIFLEVIS